MTVVVRPKRKPKATTFKSQAPRRYFFKLKGSSWTSWRSFSMRAQTKAASLSFRKGRDVFECLAASSGKSTMVMPPMKPTTTLWGLIRWDR